MNTHTPGGTVLVAEDDPGVRESLEVALRRAGYDVVLANDGVQALEAIVAHDPDVVVLDVIMPEMNGLDACRRLRSGGDRRPVLMLTARHTVDDRVAGLDAGADDYLTKPYALEELLARVRVMMRRLEVSSPAEIWVGDVAINRYTRRCERAGRELNLTKTEFDLLELLATNAGRVMTREDLYDQVWGYSFETTSRSLDVYVSYLRRKTEQHGGSRIIETVRGVGFLMARA